MACAWRILAWWDRYLDHAGRPIRPDVRLAGHEIWEQACQRTQVLLADHGPAAELMENTVAQVSRFIWIGSGRPYPHGSTDFSWWHSAGRFAAMRPSRIASNWWEGPSSASSRWRCLRAFHRSSSAQETIWVPARFVGRLEPNHAFCNSLEFLGIAHDSS
jgi:hypothetical protein